MVINDLMCAFLLKSNIPFSQSSTQRNLLQWQNVKNMGHQNTIVRQQSNPTCGMKSYKGAVDMSSPVKFLLDIHEEEIILHQKLPLLVILFPLTAKL